MSEHRDFRFGANLYVPGDRTSWVTKCREAERSGYDVISVADHVGLPPCFPTLVLAAENTERVRLNTLVLNTAFYYPGLLAREAAGTDQLIGGRLELGLGAGYAKFEFDDAGVPWQPSRARVDHLEHSVTELKRHFTDHEFSPRPAQRPGPPLLIGGRGDRVLTLAAKHADIIGFNGAGPVADGNIPAVEDAESIARRADFVRQKLGARTRDVELNLLLHWVEITRDRDAALNTVQQAMPNLTRRQIANHPTVLVGTPSDLAEQLRQTRERYGFSYFTALERHSEALSKVIEALR
ncbi:TIGR03621 family F420-dependent LLM class oxidoreductase [Myceligenerans pegani]|uniref:TIGR03621 family F420-dependent LLM class oxidoreductase n=1 Tax=Myceligenerans pegani TaxID=2776917 RepID=A0ABR9MYY1_9MICO|nr:TIGR03621 family F420-dependent LLM class oxidoreductase [Myceligenerans sp. TRM 65318]MBE1876589.1 TIGR03621 family F420-dependent LLM class oxidoreductase [Myceligenerans sp. TRM 65318]MBE3018860.1 TIGR03621 family F420-dependent LLM class oxidoreductase [Myceligenerans sp. TRM 65318]